MERNNYHYWYEYVHTQYFTIKMYWKIKKVFNCQEYAKERCHYHEQLFAFIILGKSLRFFTPVFSAAKVWLGRLKRHIVLNRVNLDSAHAYFFFLSNKNIQEQQQIRVNNEIYECMWSWISLYLYIYTKTLKNRKYGTRDGKPYRLWYHKFTFISIRMGITTYYLMIKLAYIDIKLHFSLNSSKL